MIARSFSSSRVRGSTKAPPPVAMTPNRAVDQPRHQPPLAVAEILLAEAFEDLGGAVAGGVLDRGIAVDERQAQPLGEALADSRFTGAHQADQDDWPVEALRQLFHRRGYTWACLVGQKGRHSETTGKLCREPPCS